MQEKKEQYRGPFYFLTGAALLFFVYIFSSDKDFPTQPTTANNFIVFLFILSMTISALTFFLTRKRLLLNLDDEPSLPSSKDYQGIVDYVKKLSFLLRRNNQLYLGALILSWGFSNLEKITNNSILVDNRVISFVYLFVFLLCVLQMIKGQDLEIKAATCTFHGINMEKRKGAQGYFHQTLNEPQGFEIFMLIFFRIIVPAWMFYCALDFGFLNSAFNPTQSISIFSFAIGSTILFLWTIGYHHATQLHKEMKDAILLTGI